MSSASLQLSLEICGDFRNLWLLYLSVMMISVPNHAKYYCYSKSNPRKWFYQPLLPCYIIWFNLKILTLKPQNFGFNNQSVSLPEEPHPLDLFHLFFICVWLLPSQHQPETSTRKQISPLPDLLFQLLPGFSRTPPQKQPGTCLCWILLCRPNFDPKWSSTQNTQRTNTRLCFEWIFILVTFILKGNISAKRNLMNIKLGKK